MKKLSLLFIIFKATFLFSQVPTVQWQKSLGGTGVEKVNSVIQTTNGEYLVAGYTTSTNGDVTGHQGGNDCWIVKLDASGSLVWQKAYGGSGNEGITCIKQTTDGGYIASASSTSLDGNITGNHGGSDCWIIKLDSTGNIIWQKAFGGTSNDSANSIKQTSDGGYIVSGTTSSSNGDVTGYHGGGDSWILKLDSTGNIVWQKALGGSGLDFSDDIEQTADGGYIVCASAESSNGDVTGVHGITDYWVVKLNANGTIVWQKALGGSSSERAYGIKQTLDGGYIVTGSSTSTDGDVTGNHGSNDAWIVKLNASGNLVWQKSLGGSGVDAARSIYQDVDGSYIIGAYTASIDGDVTGNHGDRDAWIAKLSTTGTLIWQKTLGGSGLDEAYSIAKTNDGHQILAGNSNSNDGDVSGNHGSADFWVAKLGPAILSTDTFSINTIKVFPNPINDKLTVKIDYFVPSQEIIITDVFGKIVLTQKLDNLTTLLNLQSLSKGVYFLNLFEGNLITTKKIIKD